MFRLFWACCAVSAVTVGGGYVIVPLMQRRFVERFGWFSAEEMLDVVAMAQAAPGSLAINAASLVGWRLRGARGAAVCAVGAVLPPMAIIMAVSLFYLEFRDNAVVAAALAGLGAGVAAIIMDAVLAMLAKLVGARKILPVIICAAAFVAAYFFRVNVVFVLAVCAGFGMLCGARAHREDGGGGRGGGVEGRG